jgi:copper(I)-binding protein
MTRAIRLFQQTTLSAAVLAMSAITPLAAQSTTVASHDAWVREPAPNRKQTALFAVIENPTTSARSIVKATSDAAETVELHEMIRDGGMMRMSPVKSIAVPAGGKAELKPGGLHIMLFGLKKQPVDGDTIRVQLTLDDGAIVRVVAPVRKAGSMP